MKRRMTAASPLHQLVNELICLHVSRYLHMRVVASEAASQLNARGSVPSLRPFSACVCECVSGRASYGQQVEVLVSQSEPISEAIKGRGANQLSVSLTPPFFHSFLKLSSHACSTSPSLSFTPCLSPEWPLHPLSPISDTPHRLAVTRILAMAVNTFPFSDPFGSKGVEGRTDLTFYSPFLCVPTVSWLRKRLHSGGDVSVKYSK